MKEFTSCKESIKNCIANKYFSIAHLHSEEETMAIHIHDCYEIYYSISGGKQFLIDNKLYDINPGDLFVINQFESHYVSQINKTVHERIGISIHPDFLKSISTDKTDLSYCFTHRDENFRHKINLNKEQQNRFMYFINKIISTEGFGSDRIEYSSFIELMTYLTKAFVDNEDSLLSSYKYNNQIQDIIGYINDNVTENVTVKHLAEHFFLSESYICRIFKLATGTTINKYIIARRISMAKSMLSNGSNINDVYAQCGFNDYTNFLKSFKKAVGVSPKKYSTFSMN
ncbi:MULTISPECIES: AraC family transcriptional regulator [unclassified Clostridium]|uniref:AraC family transcriptional regulator n=1 Tax=unclassified Clostridium TaxID=2614128 RepID=UPI0002981D8E|nr:MULTISPECIES: AraC family transcriptional regulator [unclassified Clostridium]EKQ55016.1 MAG: DNA-binding domain-containing protein, AraC-type [Clostridium sp. Maddingley MBC34-26]